MEFSGYNFNLVWVYKRGVVRFQFLVVSVGGVKSRVSILKRLGSRTFLIVDIGVNCLFFGYATWWKDY
jgi:hypothetical protein